LFEVQNGSLSETVGGRSRALPGGRPSMVGR
jgi:hypothetical protein